MQAKPGAGPQHFDFHPNGRWVYSLNEETSTFGLPELRRSARRIDPNSRPRRRCRRDTRAPTTRLESMSRRMDGSCTPPTGCTTRSPCWRSIQWTEPVVARFVPSCRIGDIAFDVADGDLGPGDRGAGSVEDGAHDAAVYDLGRKSVRQRQATNENDTENSTKRFRQGITLPECAAIVHQLFSFCQRILLFSPFVFSASRRTLERT